MKNATGVDTLDFSGKDYLGGLKSDIGEQNIDNIKTVPTDLIKLSNIVTFFLKKFIYNEKSALLIQSKEILKDY